MFSTALTRNWRAVTSVIFNVEAPSGTGRRTRRCGGRNPTWPTGLAHQAAAGGNKAGLLAQRQRGQIAADAQTHHADARRVHERLGLEPLRGGPHVLQRARAPTPDGGVPIGPAVSRRAALVEV